MCRLLAVSTRDDRPLAEAYSEQFEAFTSQSCLHTDGWGLAWYENGHLSTGRDIDEAHASGLYRDLTTHRARGPIMLAHLRKASEGLATEIANTHPFTDGDIAFAHNGEFDLSDALRRAVLDRGGRTPFGTTDTELFFSLLTRGAADADLTDASPLADWARAVQQAARDITGLVLAHGTRPPESLNCVLTTPRGFVAYTQWDPEQSKPPKKYGDYHLDFRAEAERVVVVSSGVDTSGYERLEQGEALAVTAGTLTAERIAALG